MGSLPPPPAADLAPPLRLSYPAARRDLTVVDDYHGTRIADPYRWLEEPEAEEVKAFVEAQADLTEEVLRSCGKERERLREKITEMFNHPRYDPPAKRGDRYFYLQNSGLQPQSVLVLQQGRDTDAAVLIDPNELSKDGTIALVGYSVSEDGSHVAYGLSEKGSDWVTIKILAVDGRVSLPDTISWVKFSAISWTHDGKGFFYSRFPSTIDGSGKETKMNVNHQVCYHFVGTDQSEDVVCWIDEENPRYIYEARVTEDGRYCLLYIEEGCDPSNKLYYCDLSLLPGGLRRGGRGLPFERLVDDFGGRFLYVANDGETFTFLTTKDAPRGKIVRVRLGDGVWTDVVRESGEDVMEVARAVNGGQMLVSYVRDVKHVLQLRELGDGRLVHEFPVEIGTIFGISGRRSSSEAFFGFTGFLSPGTVYRCDLANASAPVMAVFREPVVRCLRRSEFLVKQEFTWSKDGTRIPMFILCRRGIVPDGSHPALLYGYGGFGCSLTPSFNVHRIVLVQHLGAVCCVANLRGGGEYGEEWHRAGSLSQKQNTFDDFISAAQHLVSSGYTSPRRLCIEGRSNGGLLVAACINQRPDLFGCALAHVGVMDMLRFHRFTIGHAWTSDFGCSDEEEQFRWLVQYSPLHNVKRPWEQDGARNPHAQYPATMLLTADHDDRVVPLHSLKLLATMQYVLCSSLDQSPQTNPIVARIDRRTGHGGGRSTQKMIDEAADRYAFMARMIGASWKD